MTGFNSMFLVKDVITHPTTKEFLDTFRAIPINKEAIYQEVRFNPIYNTLLLQTNQPSSYYDLRDKLGVDGEVIPLKKASKKGHTCQQERVRIETYVIQTIRDPEAMKSLLKMLCINSDTFDLSALDSIQEPSAQVLNAALQAPLENVEVAAA